MAGQLARLPQGFALRMSLLVDLLALASATLLSAQMLHGTSLVVGGEIIALAAVAATVWIGVSTALGHYSPAALDRSTSQEASLLTVLVMAAGTVLTVFGVGWPLRNPLLHPAHFMGFLWVLAVGSRVLVIRPLAALEKPLENMLIVGTGPLARLTAEDLVRRRRRLVVGYLSFSNESSRDHALLRRTLHLTAPILGRCDQLEAVLRKTAVAEVYVAGNVRTHAQEMQAAVQVCERVGVPFAIPAYSLRLERAWPLSNRDGYVHCAPYQMKHSQMAYKRLLDVICSGVALALLLPLFLAVAAVIKVTSEGPVFFRQERVGLRGRRFKMLKFRSMVVNAEELKSKLMAYNEQVGPVFKMRLDPRVTRFGCFIRKYSIDELPQFINVLFGDMSIVGPRPPVPDEVARYEAWQLRRLSVRPGLTCIWQVSGRNQITFEQWMYLDLQYIDHWSLRRDLELIFRTVPAVLTGRGAG